MYFIIFLSTIEFKIKLTNIYINFGYIKNLKYKFNKICISIIF